MSNQIPIVDLTNTNAIYPFPLIDLTNSTTSSFSDSSSSSNFSPENPTTTTEPTKKEGPVLLSPQSVTIILNLLCQKVPLELALQIIAFADIHPCSILASRQKPDVELYSLYSGRRTYLTAQIPFFDNPDDVPSKRRRTTTQSSSTNPPKRIINKLVFKISGKPRRGFWLYPHESDRSFINSYSFLEAEIWRRKYDGYKEDIKANLEKQRKLAAKQPGGSENDPDHNYNIKPRSSEVWNKEFHDHYHGYSKGGKYEETKHKNGKFKVGTWLLQRDMKPEYISPGYQVVWDWRHDELGDADPDKWENGVRDENGFTALGRWHKDGKVANGAFVRELREGDEIRVVMRALANRVRCSVYGCEIECWWAI